jgi:gliding motility-associated-like protein
MKYFVLFLSKILIIQVLNSQNLVKNGGLELPEGVCSYCAVPPFWHIANGNSSPDYYNTCQVTSGPACPIAAYGPSPSPFEGEGYVGIGTYDNNSHSREIVTGDLDVELSKDSLYIFSLRVRRLNKNNYNVISQKLHIILHQEQQIIFVNWYEPVYLDEISLEFDNLANLYKEIIDDEWVLLSAFYKAKGGEKYVTIGNIDYSQEGHYIVEPGNPNLLNGCYFFIDDVQLFKSQALLCDLERGNVITPNGDGLNDVFEVKALYSNTSLYIFNRWGNLIYETNDYRNDWDAKGQPAGVYYYIFRRPNGDECRGVVTVIKDN